MFKKTKQGDNAPFAAPRQPARPRQQQQPGRQHADKRSGERAVRRQEFGGDQIGAAPNQRGERGGEDGGGAVGHRDSLRMWRFSFAETRFAFR